MLIPTFLVSDVSESLRSHTKNERCEQIAQVAHQKLATMSDSLRLLTGQKTNDSLGKPMNEFPALRKTKKTLVHDVLFFL